MCDPLEKQKRLSTVTLEKKDHTRKKGRHFVDLALCNREFLSDCFHFIKRFNICKAPRTVFGLKNI